MRRAERRVVKPSAGRGAGSALEARIAVPSVKLGAITAHEPACAADAYPYSAMVQNWVRRARGAAMEVPLVALFLVCDGYRASGSGRSRAASLRGDRWKPASMARSSE